MSLTHFVAACSLALRRDLKKECNLFLTACLIVFECKMKAASGTCLVL
jgi:hypothetical protein